MKKTLILIVLSFSCFSLYSQKLNADKDHININDSVNFNWEDIPVGSILDFDDGSNTYYINSNTGSVTHIYKASSVYYAKIISNNSTLVRKTIQVVNCKLEIYDAGYDGSFKLDFCNLISNGTCITPSTSNNIDQYWPNQILIQCIPLSADSCIMEMRLKITRLPGSYNCLDTWLKVFGSNDFGIVHFFDNVFCVDYYYFGAGSDNEPDNKNILKMNKNLTNGWFTIKLKIEGNKFTSYFDGVELASFTSKVKLGDIWGLNYASKSKTEFDFIRLYDLKNNIIYEENYNDCNNLSKIQLNINVDSSDLVKNNCDSSNYISVSVKCSNQNYLYSLDNGPIQNNGYFKNLNYGIHRIEVKDDLNCSSSIYDFLIDSTQYKDFNYIICKGDTIKHNNKIYTSFGIFYDTIINKDNCLFEIQSIKINENITCDSTNCNIKLPNVFTPNGDNINDYFEPITNLNTTIEMTIFDRWGKKVYYEKSLQPKWNGKINGDDAISDIFTYIIEAKCDTKNIIKKKGEILLVR